MPNHTSTQDRRADLMAAEHILETLRQREEDTNRDHRVAQGIIDRVKDARKKAEEAVRALAETATELRNHARRSPSESSGSFTVYANAHLRVASALSSGVRKAASMDRLIERAKAEREQAERREAERQLREEQRKADREHQAHIQESVLPMSDPDAFAEVYGDLVDA